MPALAAHSRTHPRRDSFRIPKRRRHVPEARAAVRRILKDWAVDAELADDIATVATELVSNAVRHCRVPLAEVEVVVSIRGCGLLLEVSDPDRGRVPVPRTESDPANGPEGDGGRGLTLVRALSERWGHEVRPFTQCVWAYFLLPATGPPTAVGCRCSPANSAGSQGGCGRPYRPSTRCTRSGTSYGRM